MKKYLFPALLVLMTISCLNSCCRCKPVPSSSEDSTSSLEGDNPKPMIVMYISKSYHTGVMIQESFPKIPVEKNDFDRIARFIKNNGIPLWVRPDDGNRIYKLADKQGTRHTFYTILDDHDQVKFITVSTDYKGDTVHYKDSHNIIYEIHKDRVYPVFARDSNIVREYKLAKIGYDAMLAKVDGVEKHH